MTLRYISKEAEKFANTPCNELVLLIPSYWNLKQRKFVIRAAEAAQLEVFSLLSENTAAALNYGMNSNVNGTSKILFYNLGANSLQMTIVEYEGV